MSGVEIPGMEPRHVFQLQQTMLGAMRRYDEVSVVNYFPTLPPPTHAQPADSPQTCNPPAHSPLRGLAAIRVHTTLRT